MQLNFAAGVMKTTILLAATLAAALAWKLPPENDAETKTVDAEFVAKQKKVLSFFHNVDQLESEAEYYKVAMEYSVEANIENYTNKVAVNEFLALNKTGFLPKYKVFSIFYERIRDEAIALFHLFYYAKDFETFYKTAAFVRVHFHKDQFFYALYIAIFHRPDTRGIVLPAPYEVYPDLFANTDVIFRAQRSKMQDGLVDDVVATAYGVSKEGEDYIYYSNYSTEWNYGHYEHRLSYFTEDVGLNSYYYYFHTFWPFWMKGDQFEILKERRGEIYYYFYQRLIARYYLERLVNGLGEIPNFSWYGSITTGYMPYLSYKAFPFVPRSNNYYLPTEEKYLDIQFLETYEENFLQYLQKGHIKASQQDIDFRNSKAINFVGNYWQANADLYEGLGHGYHHRSYDIVARRLLSGSPEPFDKHTVAPSAFNFYQTSLRDPMFYQLYSRIIRNILQYKKYLQPYSKENLHYVGVKVSNVHVDKLVTFFDFFDYDITNRVYKNKEEMKSLSPRYKVRQPRLNHKHFTVTIDVKSNVESEAVFKIFLGPKYDSNGYPINIEDNWMNFYEMDWFVHKLTSGQNKVERKCDDFIFFKDDSVPITKIYEYLDQGKVPKDMSEEYYDLPRRLMLPKGTDGGFPYQMFVYVYPYQAPDNENSLFVDNKPFGYPFDRPAIEAQFWQPNMFLKDILIYFEGEHFPYTLNNPFYFNQKHK